MTSRLDEQLSRYGTYLDSLLIEVEPEQAIDRATRRSRRPLPEGVMAPTWRRGPAPDQWPDIERRAARSDVARAPSWLHGAWVAAVTAAAVLVFAGGMVAGRWLFDAGSFLDTAFGESSLFNPATPADVTVLALVVAGATGGSVLLAAALTLAWRWRKHNGSSMSEAEMMEMRGGEMETMEKTIEEPDRTIQRVTRNNRWLILAVVVLLAAVVAFGAWLLIDNLVETDYEALIEDHRLATNAGDSAAVAAMYTEDGVVIDGAGIEWRGRHLIAAQGTNWARANVHSEITGQMVTYGSYVAFPERVTIGGDTFEGITVVEFEGRLIKRWVVYATQVFD